MKELDLARNEPGLALSQSVAGLSCRRKLVPVEIKLAELEVDPHPILARLLADEPVVRPSAPRDASTVRAATAGATVRSDLSNLFDGLIDVSSAPERQTS